MPNGVNCSYLTIDPSLSKNLAGANFSGSSKVFGSRRNFLRLQMTLAALGIV